MTEKQLEIFNLVNDLEKQIIDSLDPSTFVLNSKLASLTEELFTVRKKCDHEFKNGICEICGGKE